MELGPSYDVIIAGAGAAGCAAAIVLQQAGLQILLVDPCKRDFYKLGESLPGATGRLLLRLGIKGISDLLDEHSYTTCVANASSWGSDQWVYQDAITSSEGGGWHINRNHFDAALQNQAINKGVPFCAGRLHQFKTEGFRILGETSYTIQVIPNDSHLPVNIYCKWLIDATGRSSFISRKAGIRQQRFSRQMAAVSWIKSAGEAADLITRIKSVQDGWWYTAQLPNNTRVINFYSTPHTIRQTVLQPELFYSKLNEAMILPFSVRQDKMIRFRTTDASMIRGQKAVKENLLAVGDAAISFDPLSSQGIYFALYSGIKAAEAIIMSVNDSFQTDAFSQYQTQVNHVFEAVQQQRIYFYKSEYRFASNEYWKQYAVKTTKIEG